MEKRLFVSYAKPHKAVSSKTIARYVLDILGKAGVDIVTFGAHSVRGASTSKAKQSLSLAEISQAAGWSGCAMFAKRYDRPILANMGGALLHEFNS